MKYILCMTLFTLRGNILKMSECQTKAGNLECMNVWMFWTTFVFMSMLKTYSHTFSLSLSLTLTLSHSHTLSISHSITLDMLNKFCFHLYAQKSLFIGENCNAFLTSSSSPSHIPVMTPGHVSCGLLRHFLGIFDPFLDHFWWKYWYFSTGQYLCQDRCSLARTQVSWTSWHVSWLYRSISWTSFDANIDTLLPYIGSMETIQYNQKIVSGVSLSPGVITGI